jgi:hypothetical protein
MDVIEARNPHTADVLLGAGPDRIVLDLLTRSLRRANAAKYREAGVAERASNPTFAYLDALQVVCPAARGWRSPQVALPLFITTGFAFSKPGGGIRPVTCGVALRRLSFRTIAGEHDSLQTVLRATQFGVSYPGGGDDPPHPMWQCLVQAPGDGYWQRVRCLAAAAGYVPALITSTSLRSIIARNKKREKREKREKKLSA